jgi:hypothetical protein
MHNVNNQSLNVNINKNVVKLLMINVCGLVKRIQYPEFMELIEGYDILCFVENRVQESPSIFYLRRKLFSDTEMCALQESSRVLHKF